ncbi:MAG: hypothetical protein ACJ74O_13835 [Frankiaceae bacterium]
MLAIGLVLWRAVAAESKQGSNIVLLIGGAGVLLLLVAIALHLPDLTLWALLVLAGAYCLGIPVHASTAPQAAGYGLGLLGTAELSYLSYEQITWVRGERGTQRRRAGLLAGVVVATLAVDQVAIGSAGLSVGGDLLLAAAFGGMLLIVGVTVTAVLSLVSTGRDEQARRASADRAGPDGDAHAVRRTSGERT